MDCQATPRRNLSKYGVADVNLPVRYKELVSKSEIAIGQERSGALSGGKRIEYFFSSQSFDVGAHKHWQRQTVGIS